MFQREFQVSSYSAHSKSPLKLRKFGGDASNSSPVSGGAFEAQKLVDRPRRNRVTVHGKPPQVIGISRYFGIRIVCDRRCKMDRDIPRDTQSSLRIEQVVLPSVMAKISACDAIAPLRTQRPQGRQQTATNALRSHHTRCWLMPPTADFQIKHCWNPELPRPIEK